jgi:hypothetical protein
MLKIKGESGMTEDPENEVCAECLVPTDDCECEYCYYCGETTCKDCECIEDEDLTDEDNEDA